MVVPDLLWLLAVPPWLVVVALVFIRRPWAWVTVRDTGVHRYQEHPRGDRRIVRAHGGGHQPIDRGWLKTGEWTQDVAPTHGAR